MTKKIRTRSICISAAMEEEIAPLGVSHKEKGWYCVGSDYPKLVDGRLTGSRHSISFGSSGVGKINAATYTSTMIRRWHPDLFILVGTAAAIDPKLKIGDVVIASDVIFHDVDVTALGFARGEIPFSHEHVWTAGQEGIDLALRAVNRLELTAHVGRFLTGDQFIADPACAQSLRGELGGIAIEMEAAAFGQICSFKKTPWLVIKVVSDTADKSSPVDFGKFLPVAAQRCHDIVLDILDQLPYGVEIEEVRSIPTY